VGARGKKRAEVGGL